MEIYIHLSINHFIQILSHFFGCKDSEDCLIFQHCDLLAMRVWCRLNYFPFFRYMNRHRVSILCTCVRGTGARLPPERSPVKIRVCIYFEYFNYYKSLGFILKICIAIYFKDIIRTKKWCCWTSFVSMVKVKELEERLWLIRVTCLLPILCEEK